MESQEPELGCYDLDDAYPPDAILKTKGFGTRLLFTDPNLNNLFYIFGLSHLHFFEQANYQLEVKTSMSGFWAYGEKFPALRDHIKYIYEICERLLSQTYDIGSIPIHQLVQYLQCYQYIVEFHNNSIDLEGAVNLISSIFQVHVILFEHLPENALQCKLGLVNQSAPMIYLEKFGEDYHLLNFQDGVGPTFICDQTSAWEAYEELAMEPKKPQFEEAEGADTGPEDLNQWKPGQFQEQPPVQPDIHYQEEFKALETHPEVDDHEQAVEVPPTPQDPAENLLIPLLTAHRKVLQLLLPVITNSAQVIPKTSEIYDHLSFCFNSPMPFEDSEASNKMYQELSQALQAREKNEIGHHWRDCEVHTDDLQELRCHHTFCTQHIQQLWSKPDSCVCPYECPESERTDRRME